MSLAFTLGAEKRFGLKDAVGVIDGEIKLLHCALIIVHLVLEYNTIYFVFHEGFKGSNVFLDSSTLLRVVDFSSHNF